jgi:NAD(P)-dependent dehydrogenase (short-subunit alcohol dehydrogenase family)
MDGISDARVLVTGGNAGIGVETALGLAREGAAVAITARDPAKGEAAAARIREAVPGATVDVVNLDLASFASIRRCAAEVKRRFDRLDVLVNNAGVVLLRRTLTADGFEATFGVNHLGHFLLTTLLLDQLRASAPARVVVVASDAHRSARQGLDFDDLQSERSYHSFPVYGRSKLANLYFARELARRLDGTGVTVNSVHPGFVGTRLARDGDAGVVGNVVMALVRPFVLSPARGAATSIYVASSPELDGVSGQYLARCRLSAPSPVALDDEAARRLWEVSEALVASIPEPS